MGNWWLELHPLWKSIIILASGFLIYITFRIVIFKRLETLTRKTDNDLDDRLVLFLRKFLGMVLLFVVAIWVLGVWKIEVSPLLAGAGIAGVALAFAAKETISDILAGIFLIVDKPMRVGDRVKLEFIGRHWGAWGDVVDINLRRTQVRNTDGVVVSYPNSILSGSVITNFTYGTEPVRIRVRFQVAYTADLDLTEQVTKEAIEVCDNVLEGTTSVVIRSMWNDTRGHLLAGVLVEGRFKVQDVRDRTRIRSAVLKSVLAKLREARIPMPAPRIEISTTSDL